MGEVGAVVDSSPQARLERVMLVFALGLGIAAGWQWLRQDRQRPTVESRPLRFVVDVNHATAQEWGLLPGIGPGLASRILEYREQHGGFRTLEQLTEIRGIGPQRLEQIRPYLRLPDVGENQD